MNANTPISVRLDPEVRAVLESDARARGVGLATYLRELATEAAREVRRAKIRLESRRLAERVSRDAEVREFYEEAGSSAPPS